MNFDLISNLYIDDNSIDPIKVLPKNSGRLIIAGDIVKVNGTENNWEKLIALLTICCSNYHQVFYIPGNREYYTNEKDMTMNNIFLKLKNLEKIFLNLKILNNEYIILDRSIVLYGATLWSDVPYRIFPSNLPIYTLNENTITSNNITHARWMRMHYEAIEGLEKAIEVSKKFNYKMIVATHYAPIVNQALNPKYHNDIKKSMYCTDLSRFFHNIDIWMFGHTGWNCDIQEERIRLISNQYHVNVGIPFKTSIL